MTFPLSFGNCSFRVLFTHGGDKNVDLNISHWKLSTCEWNVNDFLLIWNPTRRSGVAADHTLLLCKWDWLLYFPAFQLNSALSRECSALWRMDLLPRLSFNKHVRSPCFCPQGTLQNVICGATVFYTPTLIAQDVAWMYRLVKIRNKILCPKE